MTLLESIQESLNRSGYAHLRKEQWTPKEVASFCQDNGLHSEETSYHYTVRRNGTSGTKTDWDQIAKDRADKRLKAAVAKKKKENTK
jgi:hypothetical protein